MVKDTINVGIMGLGTIGTGVYRVLKKNEDDIKNKIGSRLVIKRIADLDPNKDRGIEIDSSLFTDNIDHILEDPEIDIVVEVMGGVDTARYAIAKALENNKYVVTANKDLMAQHGVELLKIAEANGKNIFYEASVGGGIPIIRPLKHCLAANRIMCFMGIINGTTNYILTQMSRSGKEFEDALSEAQEKGFAEADPSSDLEGRDAAYKLAIMASLAFSSKVNMTDIHVEGISNIKLRDIRYAEELGFAVKLLALGEDTESGLKLRVHPVLIPLAHPLAAVSNEFNAIYLRGDAVGEVMFYGRGAGSLPTASAVCADIMDASRCIRYEVQNGILETSFGAKKVIPMSEQSSRFYLRIKAEDQPGVFAVLATAFSGADVSLDSIIQKRSDAETAEIVLVTHDVTEANFEEAMSTIRSMPSIKSINCILRVV